MLLYIVFEFVYFLHIFMFYILWCYHFMHNFGDQIFCTTGVLLESVFLQILSQTYNATLFLFDYFYVHAYALGKLFHLIKSSFSQASNHTLVLTIRLKLAKKQ